MDLRNLRSYASQQIDQKSQPLRDLSLHIWSHPETCYKETTAHQVLTDFLVKEGFTVERKFIHKTGFRATSGDVNKDGINICFICEYDGLPEIGHACGHNLIAICGVAAGIAVKAVLDKVPNKLGQV